MWTIRHQDEPVPSDRRVYIGVGVGDEVGVSESH